MKSFTLDATFFFKPSAKQLDSMCVIYFECVIAVGTSEGIAVRNSAETKLQCKGPVSSNMFYESLEVEAENMG